MTPEHAMALMRQNRADAHKFATEGELTSTMGAYLRGAINAYALVAGTKESFALADQFTDEIRELLDQKVAA